MPGITFKSTKEHGKAQKDSKKPTVSISNRRPCRCYPRKITYFHFSWGRATNFYIIGMSLKNIKFITMTTFKQACDFWYFENTKKTWILYCILKYYIQCYVTVELKNHEEWWKEARNDYLCSLVHCKRVYAGVLVVPFPKQSYSNDIYFWMASLR